MQSLRISFFAVVLFLLFALPGSAQTYDAVRDFSIQSNPNGVWSYGWVPYVGGPMTLYSWGGNTCDEVGMSFWLTSPCGDVPTVAHNDTDQPVCWLSLCVPPNYLLFDVRSTFTVLRFTTPVTGRYSMQVSFEGLDFIFPTSSYVYVLRNSKTSLLSALITSYNLPLNILQQGSLSAGDTVDFIVDWGADKGWGGDSTGGEVEIWGPAQR